MELLNKTQGWGYPDETNNTLEMDIVEISEVLNMTTAQSRDRLLPSHFLPGCKKGQSSVDM